MPPWTLTTRSTLSTALWCGLLLLCMLAPDDACAQGWEPKPLPPAEDDDPSELPDDLSTHPDVPEDFDGYSEQWTGAFLGVGVFGGVTLIGNDSVSSDLGWSVGVKTRASVVHNLLSAQLDYRYGAFEGTLSELPTRQTLTLDQHAVSFGLGIQPLFLANLGAERIFYALAASYLQFGLTLAHLNVKVPARLIDDAFFTWGLHLGAGFDYPVTDPDASGSLWLGIQYRWQTTAVDRAPFDDERLSEHLFWLRLSYRHNGLF